MTKIRMLKIEGRRKFEDMTDIEASYLAALTDGEGCVDALHKGGNHYPRVAIGMTAELPRDLWKEWGGCFYMADKEPRRKPMNKWQILNRDRVRAFLQRIMPFLRVKLPQADLALQMLDVLDEKPEGWKDKLNRMAKEMHKLNKRGR